MDYQDQWKSEPRHVGNCYQGLQRQRTQAVCLWYVFNMLQSKHQTHATLCIDIKLQVLYKVLATQRRRN